MRNGIFGNCSTTVERKSLTNRRRRLSQWPYPFGSIANSQAAISFESLYQPLNSSWFSWPFLLSPFWDICSRTSIENQPYWWYSTAVGPAFKFVLVFMALLLPTLQSQPLRFEHAAAACCQSFKSGTVTFASCCVASVPAFKFVWVFTVPRQLCDSRPSNSSLSSLPFSFRTISKQFLGQLLTR